MEMNSPTEDIGNIKKVETDGSQIKNLNAYMALLYQQFLSTNFINNSPINNSGGDSFNCAAFVHYFNKLALLANVSKNQLSHPSLPLLQDQQGIFISNLKSPQIKTDPEILDLKCQNSCSSIGDLSPEIGQSDIHLCGDAGSRLSPPSCPEDLSLPKHQDKSMGSSRGLAHPSVSFPIGKLKKSKPTNDLFERPSSDEQEMSNCNDQSFRLDSNLCSTHDIARMVAAELRHYGIPQAVFSQRVLGRSQGTLSDLLRNPKPWNKLKAGRETFRKMLDWLNLSEEDRLAVLRLHPSLDSTSSMPTSVASSSTLLSCPPNLQRKGVKKPRLVFTEIQRRTLLAIFQEMRHPSRDIQATIAEQLNLKLSTVSNFFMNARRRSVDKYATADSTDEKAVLSSSFFDREA